MGKKVKAYEYSKYQYRVDVHFPDGRKKHYASYVNRQNAERAAYRLTRCVAMRATVTRRCDNRIIWDNHNPVKVKSYSPLLFSEASDERLQIAV